jgi:predicted nuclease of predicted toxin-antitoxin system
VRFLANENFPRTAVEALRQAGHDTAWIVEDTAGVDDDAVLARARNDGRVLLTFDKDFGTLAFNRGSGASRGIVLFRVVPAADDIARFVVATLGSRDDWEGCFSMVEAGRVRMRPLPPKPRR